MEKVEKIAVVEKIKQDWAASKGTVLIDFRGLTVAEITGLRKKLRKSGVSFRVVPNTLAKRAIVGQPGGDLAMKLFEGPTAVAFSPADAMAPIRILSDSKKEIEKLQFKAAVVDGQVYDGREIETLAKLPSRQELISKFAGGLASPISEFASVLKGILSQFARVLDAVRQKKEKEGAIA